MKAIVTIDQNWHMFFHGVFLDVPETACCCEVRCENYEIQKGFYLDVKPQSF